MARLADSPPPPTCSTAFKPTPSSTDNPPMSDWVIWPGVEVGSQVTLAPTWWLASLGLRRENLWETELAECTKNYGEPRAKIEGALFLELDLGPGPSTYALRCQKESRLYPTMVYFSDDAEMVYLNLDTARGLGLQ